MPDIPVLTQFTAGMIADPDDFNENFYNAVGAAPTSLEVVNGWLSSANLASASASITTRMVQRGQMSRGRQVGKTATLDYIWEMFPMIASNSGEWKAVPGLAQRFYLPRTPAITIFTWSVIDANTRPEASSDGSLEWKLRINNTDYQATQRNLCSKCASNGTSTALENANTYSGSFSTAGLTAGWHDVSLRLKMQLDTGVTCMDHVRLHARSFRVMWFK